ncbi:T9SS type A sorting domain-containing protein [Lacinutrix sp. C3R15]|uniref:fibronectin type III domain-containing protein n=1 Tax=Flavobacteriaceae TaxID=49546 RepID=UPI001C091D95|nr:MULTISPECIES: T9SS type A sorting domain-containing protein [Flavobacteriaceae]MBU2940615.1 T9SS type A sorting domain-containing protein [Lacinutrix sp. C3R15]MDO6623933.1 T9SS type A sorting domain-containing protein [Oceanihabitans sp. 1_MG-2023]
MKKITLLLAILFTSLSFSQVSVGSGQLSSNAFPISFYWSYSYSQVIYNASDINASGNITSISLEMVDEDAIPDSDDNIDLWIGHTTKTAFTSSTDWVDVATLDKKMTNGTLTKSGTTITLTFDTPFAYNGIDNIVLAIDANEDSYDTSSDKVLYTSSDSNISLYFRSDGTNPDPTSAPTGTLSPMSPNITFHGIVQSCPTPTNLSADAIALTQADLSWTDIGTATSWNVEVVVAGASATGTATDEAVSNPYTKTGLNSSTSYEFYVQGICAGGELSSWAGPFSFTTACGAFTVPYFEDFDSADTGSVSTTTTPDCWTFIDEGAGSGYVNSSGEFYLTNSDDTAGNYILVSPETTDLSSGLNRVVFEMDSATGNELIVGTLTNPEDASTFTAIETLVAPSYNFETYSIDIPVGTDKYLAFKNGLAANYDYFYLDNISVVVIPSCEAPTELTATNIADVSADLSWTEVGTATTWNVEWGTASFTQGNGTMVTGVTANPYTLTGLTAETEYEYYVQADCGEGDLSAWAGPFAFTTGVTPPACGGGFYDTGGATSSYSSYENYTITICPDASGDAVSVAFTSFLVEGKGIDDCWDSLFIYDGADETATPITPASLGLGAGTEGFCWQGVNDGTADLTGEVITSSDASGCLTFTFTSDGSTQLAGWEATVSCASLSSQDIEFNNLFSYYPNPVNDNLTLTAQKDIENIAVYNMLGQEVLRTAPNAVNTEVNMSALQAGAYFVKVTIGNATETVKVIKK